MLHSNSLYFALVAQSIGVIAVIAITIYDQAYLALGLLGGIGVLTLICGISGAIRQSRYLLSLFGAMCFFYAIVASVFITFSAGYIQVPSDKLVKGNMNLRTYLIGKTLADTIAYQPNQVKSLQVAYPVIYVYGILTSAIAMLVAIVLSGPETIYSSKSIHTKPSQVSLAPSIRNTMSNRVSSRPAFSASRFMPSIYNDKRDNEDYLEENFEEKTHTRQSVVQQEEAAAVLGTTVPISNKTSIYGGVKAQGQQQEDVTDQREQWFSKYYDNDAPQFNSDSPKQKSLFDDLYKPDSVDFSVGDFDRIQSIKPLHVKREDPRESGTRFDYPSNTSRTQATQQSEYPLF